MSIMLLWTVSSSHSNPTVVRVRYGQFFAPCIVLVPHVARCHSFVEARRPHLTVVFLTFTMLAQGGWG